MRKIFKLTLLISFALVAQNQIWGNLDFHNSAISIIKVAFILTIFELLIKPIIKIILFPINLLTLGLFRVVINTVGFYMAAFFLSDFVITNIHTLPQNIYGLNLPAINLIGFWAHLVNSTSNSFLLYIFKSIIKSKKDKK
ncbi:MAG: phage holin family protein [Microgenomates group bacterium]